MVANDYGVIAFVVILLLAGLVLYGTKKAVGKLLLAIGVGGVLTLISYFVLILTGVYDNVSGTLNPTPVINVFAIFVILAGLGAGYYAVKRAKVRA